MDMKSINAGKLRAIGYAPRERRLRVELDDGRALEYSGVGEEIWRRLSNSASACSYYRDVIEEEFTAHPVSASRQNKQTALDDLFKK